MSLGIITAIYGNYDQLRPLPESHGFDQALCITDNPNLAASGWLTVYEPQPNIHPRLAAKPPKMTPWRWLETTTSCWVDGSWTIVGSRFRAFIEPHLEENDLTAWRHPDSLDRDCLYQEAALCWDWVKYRGSPLREQVAHYRAMGMPEHYGLFAASVLAWRHSNAAKSFGQAWLKEQHTWSIQDQVSLPYLLWSNTDEDFTFGTFHAAEYDNPWLIWNEHASRL